MRLSVAKLTEIAERRREVIRLRVQGFSVKQIAANLGIAERTVFRDLDEVYEEWKAGNAADVSTMRAEQLAKLQAVESEAWAAWERSKTKWKKRTRETTDPGSGVKSKTNKTETEAREGDKQWLDVIRDCHDRISKLFGLEPKTEDVTGSGRPPVFLFLPDNGRDQLPQGETYVQLPGPEAPAPPERADDQPATETVDFPSVES